MTRFALILGAALVAAGPLAAAHAGEFPDVSSETQTFSETAGTLLGAASQCAAISGARIDAADRKVFQLLARSLLTQDDLAEAHRRFTENMQPGRDAIRTGALSCPQVEASLAQLERFGDPAPRRTE